MVVRPRTPLPEIVLVVGLSLVAGWIVRTLAPPSLVRDGQRLPVGLASLPGPGTHHEAAGLAPSSVSDEPVPHFLGGAFLAAHLLAIALAIGLRLVRRVRARLAAQLLFATLIATAAGAAAMLAARFGYGDRLAPREVLLGGVEVARYAFIAALALVVIFGFRDETERIRT